VSNTSEKSWSRSTSVAAEEENVDATNLLQGKDLEGKGREPLFEFYGEVVEENLQYVDEQLHSGDVAAGSQVLHRPFFVNARPATSFHENRLQRMLARQSYNASILPNKVIMVRHGQSAGNVAQHLYSEMPDNSIPLTDFGWEQARMAGKALKDSIITPGETVHFIVSPYVRTMETFHGMVSAWCDPMAPEFRHILDKTERRRAWYQRLHECGITWHEDPRIREQDFGNYQDVELIQRYKRERERFGVFYYRFQNGESGTDVFDRISTFLDSLWRAFDTCRYQNCVLVTHGISIRVLLARYFRYSVDQFHELANPKNCEMVMLHHDGSGMLRLQGRCQLEIENSAPSSDPNPSLPAGENSCGGSSGHLKPRVTGYTMHKGLRLYPEKFTMLTRRKIRLCPDE